MSLDMVLLAIVAVFVLSLIASVALVRGTGAGRLVRAELADLLRSEYRPGALFETIAEVRIAETKGLDLPPTIFLAGKGARIQATASSAVLTQWGLEGASLLPLVPGEGQIAWRSLGNHIVIGTLEELPVRHLRILAMSKTA